ncbi:MAG: hypothetical protein CL610_11355 [Anaerolineaceae bacterium]|nr:hypothetical protein [Anaerolineaceae bacterium]
MRQWRLIYDLPTPGTRNMAIDEALLMTNPVQPVLRLYRWMPFCLSLGYGQRSREADRQRLADRGWDLVRRPTGGRAILHGDELTYSLVLPADHPLAAGGVLPSYQRISEALVRSLREMVTELDASQQDNNTASGPVCFDVPSHYELTVQGRKLVGSAQVRRKSGILQHGTIPLHGDIGRICDVLAYTNEADRETARQHVRQRATTLGEALRHQRVNWESVADSIARGFASTFGIEWVPGTLTDAEQETANWLENDVYGSDAWTFRR